MLCIGKWPFDTDDDSRTNYNRNSSWWQERVFEPSPPSKLAGFAKRGWTVPCRAVLKAVDMSITKWGASRYWTLLSAQTNRDNMLCGIRVGPAFETLVEKIMVCPIIRKLENKFNSFRIIFQHSLFDSFTKSNTRIFDSVFKHFEYSDTLTLGHNFAALFIVMIGFNAYVILCCQNVWHCYVH